MERGHEPTQYEDVDLLTRLLGALVGKFVAPCDQAQALALAHVIAMCAQAEHRRWYRTGYRAGHDVGEATAHAERQIQAAIMTMLTIQPPQLH